MNENRETCPVKLYAARVGKGRQGEHEGGRALLALGLLREYGLQECPVIEKGPKGKPYLAGCPKLHFNISHSHGLAACAFSPMEVGLDVQYKRPVELLSLLPRVLPPEQFSAVLEASSPTEAFYRQWCLREAHMKWTGEGFALDPRQVDFSKGSYALVELAKGYACALWAERPVKAEVIWCCLR